mgnify:FL=1|tara:strand:- start:637 stop:831 length:195 start_codon:yes stop_codon:yes gene_type:complete
MIKVGNRVSLFHNIGKEGSVIGMKPIRINTSFTSGSATNSWKIIVKWDDGSESMENISDVMRID